MPCERKTGVGSKSWAKRRRWVGTSPCYTRQVDNEIRSLLDELQHDEDVRAAVYDYMLGYRVFALARPRQEHVDLLRVFLKTKLSRFRFDFGAM
jgi:hypothetical protein